jgi:hypothetical protein
VTLPEKSANNHVIMAKELVKQWFGTSSSGVTRQYTSNSGQWQNSEGAKL